MIERQPPIDRAKELVQKVILEYRFLATQLKPDKTINMVCTIGGVTYEVYELGANNGIVSVDTQHVYDPMKKENLVKLHCPIEQISFAIIFSDKISK